MLEQGLKWLTRQACVRNSLPQLDPEIATDPTTPCGGGGGGVLVLMPLLQLSPAAVVLPVSVIIAVVFSLCNGPLLSC